MRRKLVVLLVGIVILLLSGCGCDHEYDEGVVTTEPTCVDTGVKTFTCTKCGDTYTEEIPLGEHKYVATITKEPTSEELGERTYTCSVCGDSYTETMHDVYVEITDVYPSDALDTIYLFLLIDNRGDKEIKGIQGRAVIRDMFGTVIADLECDMPFDSDKYLLPGYWKVASQYYAASLLDSSAWKLFYENFEDLDCSYHVTQVVYTDGTKDVF